MELQIYDDGVYNINVQESLLFIAEAFQYSEKYVKSNEKLSILLQAFASGDVSPEIQLKTIKLVSGNLTSMENWQEAINYLMKSLKLTDSM